MKPSRVILAALAFVLATAMQAQVSIRVNIGTAPVWAPEVEAGVRYYYLPEVDAYYDIPSAMFIYMDNGVWAHRHHLPARYRDYDLHRCQKVVIRDYRGDSPYSYYRYSYRNEPRRDYDRCRDDRPGRVEYREHGRNDLQSYETSYRGEGKHRGDFYERSNHDQGRGHAYGRNKGWRD